MATPKADKDQLNAKQEATSPIPKGSSLGHSEMLTPSEIESLRQDLREAVAYLRNRRKLQTKPKSVA
jgi:hypothetical protein